VATQDDGALVLSMVMTTLADNKKAAIEQTMRDFQQFFSLKGGLVLEIGSLRNATAERLLDMGAESVICSNIAKDAQVVQSDRISYVMADATDTGFGSATFDVVFGRAMLEHIKPMSNLRDEIIRILKPGGIFYLDGGPMWCSPRGHHLWLRAPSGRRYYFPDEDCPIRDWEHLLLSEEEMVRALQQRHVDERDVRAIVHYIYHAEGQNRLPTSSVCESFLKGTILDVVIIRNDYRIAPPMRLVSKYGTHNLITSRVVIAGRKKVSPCEPDILSKMMTKPVENLSTRLPKFHQIRHKRLVHYLKRNYPMLITLGRFGMWSLSKLKNNIFGVGGLSLLVIIMLYVIGAVIETLRWYLVGIASALLILCGGLLALSYVRFILNRFISNQRTQMSDLKKEVSALKKKVAR
jgi:SAM-dependent methyltransferase